MIRYYGFHGPRPEPDKWVFIAGNPNSGTTLLQNLLAMHPDIGSLPKEGQFLNDRIISPRDFGYPRKWALRPDLFYMDETSGSAHDAELIKRQWGARFNNSSRPVLLEKSPTNGYRLMWLQQYFENAHFIILVRNGYAVAEGIRRKTGYSIRTGARQWRMASERMLQDSRMLKKCLTITYEELTDTPTEMLQKVYQFLGISENSFDPAAKLVIHERKSSIRNMNEYSFQRLTPEDIRMIRHEAAEILQWYGYSEPCHVARGE